jgi:hypothetical protein
MFKLLRAAEKNGFTIRSCVCNWNIVVSFDAAASDGEILWHINSWGLFVIALARGKQRHSRSCDML